LIKVRTTIGYGSPKKANTRHAHGEALGEDEVKATREHLGWNYPPFELPEDALNHWRQAIPNGAKLEEEWNQLFARYKEQYPEEARTLDRMHEAELPEGWDSVLPTYKPEDKGIATRVHSGNCLNALAEVLPELVGGSADLAPSNNTQLKNSGDFQKGQYENRYIRFGVREHGMGSICNGLALEGSGLIPYCATFLVFTDYMRAAIRLSALSEGGVIYVMTHDSIALGEDGPTHQPVEHIASLRAIPDLYVIRPADGNETSGAYKMAIKAARGKRFGNKTRPTLLALTRQAVPNLAGSSIEGVTKGAYILSDSDGTPDLILIGTGSETQLCVKAAEQLRNEGNKVRVVSMPCWELFQEQDAEYQESVLPKAVKKRVSVEAGTTFGWCRYVGDEGIAIGIDQYGSSAPGNVVMENFGFTVDNVVTKAKVLLG